VIPSPYNGLRRDLRGGVCRVSVCAVVMCTFRIRGSIQRYVVRLQFEFTFFALSFADLFKTPINIDKVQDESNCTNTQRCYCPTY
jgi:hypothetical protein